jgi:regulator of protease activity HflC (stomatin/prohibitin superfamily)
MSTGSRIRIGILVVVVIAALITISNSFVVIETGTRGVVKTFGRVTDTYGEGLHFMTPFVTTITIVDVKIQKLESSSVAASKDLQTVTADVALNYSVDPAKAGNLVSDIGADGYDNRIIAPAISESVKAATAQYTAEQLITQRAQVSDSIRNTLAERLKDYHIIVHDLSITNSAFSEAFSVAIESKQVAEQDALKAKQELERTKIEAQQQLARADADAQTRLKIAEAEAEALRLQREVISPELIQLRFIEKWNGEMPRVVTSDNGMMTMLNLPTEELQN